MKKIKSILVAVFASFLFVSCSSVDSLIDQYEKACKKGDTKKMYEIGMKLSKEELTNEQLIRISDISGECVADDIFDKL